jgi:hypothetical protein
VAIHRNRVTFANEALFVSPTATGFHYTGRNGIGLKTPPKSINDSAGWQCPTNPPPIICPSVPGFDPSFSNCDQSALTMGNLLLHHELINGAFAWTVNGDPAMTATGLFWHNFGFTPWKPGYGNGLGQWVLAKNWSSGDSDPAGGNCVNWGTDMQLNVAPWTHPWDTATVGPMYNSNHTSSVGLFTRSTTFPTCPTPFPPWNPYGTDPAYASGQGTIIKQLRRIQSCSYGFNTNLTNVNQYGNTARLDSISVEEPLVNLEFSYYLLDGFNERHIGFVIDGSTSPIAQDVSGADGKNYFIETVHEGRSVVGGDAKIADSLKTVVSIGNGFVTNYSASMAVNSVPTATVSVDAYNIKADNGTEAVDIPGLNLHKGTVSSDAWLGNVKGNCNPNGCTGLFTLPAATSAYSPCEGVSALRPGDVVLTLRNAAMISQQVSGAGALPPGTALIQSATVDFPLSRTNIKRIGNRYPFTKALDFPLTVSLDIEATVSDIKQSNLIELLCSCKEHELLITIYDPACADCNFANKKEEDIALQYKFTRAILESENFASAIGENKSVSLRFSTQMGTE